MATKMGVHLQSWGSHTDWILASKPSAIKVLENTRYPLERYKAEVGGLVVGRMYHGVLGSGEPDFSDPAGQAGLWADAISRYFGDVQRFLDCVVTCNEVGQDGDIVSRHADFEVRICEILHSRGYRVAVGSFSVGNPPGDSDALKANWRRFLPALQVADALSLHEYSAPRMWTDETWRCLRYRRVVGIVAELGIISPPIIIGETGIDWGVFEGAEYSKKGWLGGGSILPLSPSEYVRDLDWYAKQIEQDPVVLAAFIFNIGYSDWRSFEVGGIAEIGDYIRTNTAGPAVWPSGVSPSPTPTPAPKPGGTMPTLYEEWFNTPNNPEPRTGTAGLVRFREHAARVAPGRDPYDLGFPRFGENLATQKIDEIQQKLNELRGLVK